MKKIFWLATLVLLASIAPGITQGVLLGPGDVYTYSFSDLPFLRNTTAPNDASATVFFPNNRLDLGEEIQFELFETSTNSAPDYITWVTRPWDRMRLGGTDGFWTDLQGAIRVTMISGSVDITQLSFEVVQGGQVFGSTVVVPEPGSMLLWVAALGLVWWRVRRR